LRSASPLDSCDSHVSDCTVQTHAHRIIGFHRVIK